MNWDYLNPMTMDTSHPLIIRLLHLPIALAVAVVFALGMLIVGVAKAIGTALSLWFILSGMALSMVVKKDDNS